MTIRAYPALYLSKTPSQETGTRPPSCLEPSIYYLFCSHSAEFEPGAHGEGLPAARLSVSKNCGIVPEKNV